MNTTFFHPRHVGLAICLALRFSALENVARAISCSAIQAWSNSVGLLDETIPAKAALRGCLLKETGSYDGLAELHPEASRLAWGGAS